MQDLLIRIKYPLLLYHITTVITVVLWHWRCRGRTKQNTWNKVHPGNGKLVLEFLFRKTCFIIYFKCFYSENPILSFIPNLKSMFYKFQNIFRRTNNLRITSTNVKYHFKNYGMS